MYSADIYSLIVGIFNDSMLQITNGLYEGASRVFNNDFFEAALALSIVWLGFMIATRKIKEDELSQKVLWLIIVFTIVKTILWNKEIFDYLIEILDLPREVFLNMINYLVSTTNADAQIEIIIRRIIVSQNTLTNYLYDQSSITNMTPFVYSFILWLTGTFLILVILLTSVFSIFICQVVLAFAPLIIPFLIWKKTEYIFYGWAKLYVSVSLYAPFTVLFGLLSVSTSEFSIVVIEEVQNDFKASTQYLIALVLIQLLTALAVFKIPNLINQVIGSSNEGSSLTSGIGTISTGGAILGAVSKYTGLNLVARGASSASKSGVKAGVKTAKNVASSVKDWGANKVQVR